MIKKEEYYTNQHSCFLLQYHFILVTKYRKPVIVNELKDFLINYTKKYFEDKRIKQILFETIFLE